MKENEIFNMYFGIIEDERDQYTIRHRLIDILKLVMIAVLCGMDELDKMVDYGKNKKEFLEKEKERLKLYKKICKVLNAF